MTFLIVMLLSMCRCAHIIVHLYAQVFSPENQGQLVIMSPDYDLVSIFNTLALDLYTSLIFMRILYISGTSLYRKRQDTKSQSYETLAASIRLR